jgi:hypothetical protein
LTQGQLAQVVPAEDAGAVTIIEMQLHRVMADGVYLVDFYEAFAGLQHLLAHAMSAYLRRWRINTQEFGRQGVQAAIGIA